MALPLTDVLKPLTAEEILDLMKDVAQTIGLETTSWQTGELPLAILEIIAQALAKIWNDACLPILSAPFLDYCSGDILTLVAASIYGTLRYDATFAAGPGTVTNSSSDPFSFSAGDIRILKNNKVYRNTSTGTLDPWDGVTLPKPTVGLTFTAEEVGAASTLVPDLTPIEVISGQIGISVTADSAWVGQDEERDDDLRTRARANAASAGTGGAKLAYEYALRSTVRPDGTNIPITRVRVETPPGDGTLTIYVATPSGEVDPSDVALLQAAATLVETQCETVTVLSASPVNVPITADIYVRVGTTSQNVDITALATTALTDWFRTTPIGGWKLSEAQIDGYLYISEVGAVVSQSAESIFKVDITSPSADVLIQPDEVATIGTLTFNIIQVAV